MKPPLKDRWPSGQDWAVQALAAALGFFGGEIGFLLGREHLVAAPIWPTAGLALAGILVLGYRFWPGLLLGTFLLKLTILAGARLNPIAVVSAALCMSSGETLQALVGAWLAETYARGRYAMDQPRTVALFFALCAILSPIFSAASHSFAAVLAGFLPWRELGNFWESIWLSNMLGVVLIAPLLLVWSYERVTHLSSQRIAEVMGALVLLVAGSAIAFGPFQVGKFRGVAFSCMLIPMLLWTAFRFGDRGTVTANFIFGCLALVGTLNGHGPFAVGDEHTSFLLAQNFIGAFALMALLLAAEVKQRQRIDDGLRASEQRYRDLFEFSPQAMWVFDYESLRFLAVNQAAIKQYGYSRDEFLSMTICDIRPPEQAASLKEIVQQARLGLPLPQHDRHRKKDGTLIDVETGRYNLVMDGREAAMILITDITERKQAQERAMAFSELGRGLSGASTPIEATRIIIETADSLFGWSACRLELGPARSGLMETVYGVESIDGRRCEVPAVLAQASELTRRALDQGGQLVAGESPGSANHQPNLAAARICTKMVVPVRKEQCVLGVLSIEGQPGRPYTPQDLQVLQALADHCGGALERIRAETALRESDQRLRLALAASRMGIWTLELQEHPRIISSPELDAIFGLKPGEFDGTEQTLFTFIHPDDHAMVRTTLAQAIKAEGEYEIEFRILPRDRPIGWLLARGCSCFDASGEPTRLIGVAFDITARKASEDEVLRLNLDLERRVAERTAALEAVNKELESFSYSVSHDLRAPLRSIRGFSEVLLDRYGAKLDDRGREFLKRACESSNQMDLLIDDLLKLSRIGRAELHQQHVDLSDLAQSIAAELSAAAEPKRTVKFLIEPGLQASGDERLLRIALENLLRNAWKFTANQPKTRIEFGQIPGPPPAFFVRDNGAGFDMAYASRLFGVFQRLHSSDEFPGSGIGLATVQRVLNRHGGRAWAESALNQGATFYFSLPENGAIKSSLASFPKPASDAIIQEQVTA